MFDEDLTMHPIYPIDEEGNIKIKPIGRVLSPQRWQRTGGFMELESRIAIDPDLEPLLEGFDEFSHIVVVYWLSEICEYSIRRRPQGREDVPRVGMLASR